ncbi:PQQ-binding-like beta-propeller repeat protein [Candidatus Purcelliella pentastirinorum]|uniref:outer membrane protein assembly factor BamB family protein n=1 Tax=Candidatus Purcelliella pentastirinorum TaxID=472834 RepID=UPI0023676DDB|nr:PQQ-binding-like beta-propeller repeat protein [Candidatus Purcelliella pentastirinorum]WDI78837.1 PQQ-binding-like beta-propeller repeat protein [Candidatus Purcelliella pentastirinorum]WDR79970.1 PQQ-binding-like beta-propeller repeat protein [Candidatus Purcelliella pentastirinorum]
MNVFRLYFLILLIFFLGCTDNDYIHFMNKPYLKKVWQINIGKYNNEYYNYSFSFNKDIIFIYNYSGIIKAISLKDGKQKWFVNLSCKYKKFRNDGIFLLGNICVDIKNIYFGTENAKLYSINFSNGVIDWCVDAAGEILSKPFLFNDLVLVHTVNGVLQAFNKNNGEIKWSIFLGYSNFGVRGESEPVMFNNLIIIGSDNGFINVISPYDGKLIWKKFISYPYKDNFNNMIDVDYTPIIYHGVIYSLSSNGCFLAIDFISGDILYKYDNKFIKNIFIYNNCIYLLDNMNYLISLNIDNYYIKSQRMLPFKYDSISSILYKNYIIIGDNLGYLYLIDINNFSVFFRSKISNFGLNIIFYKNNKLFILDNNGYLFFYN